MKTARDREEFCWWMGREGYPLELCRDLLRLAATYKRLAEGDCNGTLTEKDKKRWDACEARIALLCKEARNAGSYLGAIVPKFQGDPRGACVKLRLPSGRGNDFGGEGLLCVPA